MQNKHFFCLTSYCLHIVIVNTLYLYRLGLGLRLAINGHVITLLLSEVTTLLLLCRFGFNNSHRTLFIY